MSEDGSLDREGAPSGVWDASNFLTPPVCAVAAFTLAVVAMLGQNVVSVGVGAVIERTVDSPGGFYVGWGVALVAQVGVVLLLARRTFDATGRWESTLGRAAVVVSGVALVAALLLVVGGAGI